MANLAIAPRSRGAKDPIKESHSNRRSTLLGVEPVEEFVEEEEHVHESPVIEQAGDLNLQIPEERKPQGETLEKVVKRIPTMYVIAFFGVVVSCAVLIIWNILQVNTLTLKRGKTLERIAQAEQRLIRLRAQEMQLSAPSRIKEIARGSLGMTEENGTEVLPVSY